MSDNDHDLEKLQANLHEIHTISLWTALGEDHAEDYSTEEMVEILSRKVNSGDISHEEMHAAIELVKNQRE